MYTLGDLLLARTTPQANSLHEFMLEHGPVCFIRLVIRINRHKYICTHPYNCTHSTQRPEKFLRGSLLTPIPTSSYVRRLVANDGLIHVLTCVTRSIRPTHIILRMYLVFYRYPVLPETDPDDARIEWDCIVSDSSLLAIATYSHAGFIVSIPRTPSRAKSIYLFIHVYVSVFIFTGIDSY